MSTQLLEAPATSRTDTDGLSHYWCLPCDLSRCGLKGAPPIPYPPTAVRCNVCIELCHTPCTRCGSS